MKTFLFILIASLFVGCVPKDSTIAVNFNKKNSVTSPSQVLSASVSSVQIVNNQLIITGTGLTAVTNVKVDGVAFNENFSIESKSATQIIANSIRAFSFDVSKLFNVILSDANASATFPIDFSLCNATLNGKGFDCAAPVADKDVLSYDAVSGKWKPRAVSGLNYLGAFDASANPATGPAVQPAGAYYIISASGAIAAIPFTIGDWLVSNGSAWQKIDNSTAVLSVFGRNGTVTAQTGDYNLDMLGDISFPTAPVAGKVLKFDGTNWVAGDDLSGGGAGSVNTAEIADGAVTDAKIATLATSKLTGTISSSQITDGTIVNADINAAAAIDYSKLNIPNTTIPYAKLNIADGDIPAAKISGLPSTSDFVSKSTNSTVLSELTISGTGSIIVPTPTLLTHAANMGYVQSFVDTFGKWTKSGSDISFSSGNVGIGGAASTSKLDVSGDTKTRTMSLAHTAPILEIKNTGFTNAQVGRTGYIQFSDSTGTRNSYIGDDFGSINALMIATTIAEPIYFQTGGVDRMGITSGGYVGIGTLGPSAKLHVQDGPVIFKGTGSTLIVKPGFGSQNALSTESAASFDNEGPNGAAVNMFTSSDKTGSYYFGNSGSPQQGYLRYFVSATTANQYMSLAVNSAERLRITSTGNVGIGITNPAGLLSNSATNTGDSGTFAAPGGNGMNAKAINWEASGVGYGLQVVNNSAISASNGINIYTVASDSASNLLMARSNGLPRFLVRADGNVGIGTYTPDEAFVVSNGTTVGKYTTGGWTHSSDRRLKHDISPIQDALDKILKIRGVEYVFNSDSKNKTQLGFIAQEVEPIFPEVVQTDKKGFKSMIYSNLIAPLVESVKALYGRIVGVEKEIEVLRAKSNKLELENAKLKKENEAIKARLERIEKSLNLK